MKVYRGPSSSPGGATMQNMETDLRVRMSHDLKAKVAKTAESFEMSMADFVRWMLIEACKED